MKREDISRHIKVIDRWYRDWGIGTIILMKKNQIKILFSCAGVVTYDNAHLQFLNAAGANRMTKSQLWAKLRIDETAVRLALQAVKNAQFLLKQSQERLAATRKEVIKICGAEPKKVSHSRRKS